MIYTCAHNLPHTGPLSSAKHEVAWRDFLREKGWLDAGYCYHDYPEWLREAWENNVFIKATDAGHHPVARFTSTVLQSPAVSRGLNG